jgi:hypothetical protein
MQDGSRDPLLDLSPRAGLPARPRAGAAPEESLALPVVWDALEARDPVLPLATRARCMTPTARDRAQAHELFKAYRSQRGVIAWDEWGDSERLEEEVVFALAQREAEVREACARLADAATERETEDPTQLAIKNVAAMIAAAIRGLSGQVVLCFWDVELATVRCALHNQPVLKCPMPTETLAVLRARYGAPENT